MKQPDYTNIAPRGQMQPQNPYVQPGYNPNGYQQGYSQPQYQQPVQYQQGYYPQQQVQQPFQQQAPQGYFVPHQAMAGMEGSQEFRDAYQKNLDAFNEANRKIKEGVNESEAVKRVKEMSSYKTKVENDWKDSVQGVAVNTTMMINYIENLCVSLENPQEWLPAFRAKYVDMFRTKTTDLVKALKETSNLIRKLSNVPAQQPPGRAAEGQ